MYVDRHGVPKDIKQTMTELKKEIDDSTITVGDFCNPLSLMDKT